MNYDDLENLARQKEDENSAFRRFLKFYDELSDEQIDKLVYDIADAVAVNIEYTNCGRCCKQLKPIPLPIVKTKNRGFWDGQGTSYTPGEDKVYELGSVSEAEKQV